MASDSQHWHNALANCITCSPLVDSLQCQLHCDAVPHFCLLVFLSFTVVTRISLRSIIDFDVTVVAADSCLPVARCIHTRFQLAWLVWMTEQFIYRTIRLYCTLQLHPRKDDREHPARSRCVVRYCAGIVHIFWKISMLLAVLIGERQMRLSECNVQLIFLPPKRKSRLTVTRSG